MEEVVTRGGGAGGARRARWARAALAAAMCLVLWGGGCPAAGPPRLSSSGGWGGAAALGCAPLGCTPIGCAPLASAPAVRASGSLLLMDTLVSVEAWAPAGRDARVEGAVRGALDLLADLDRRLDFYSPASDLGRLNSRAGEGWVEVGPELFACLTEALRFARLSAGAFDPTVGPLVRLWGFGERPRVPSSQELARARDLVGYRGLELGPGRRARLLVPGAAVDLGAIAKGYAVDRAAGLLRRAGVGGGLVVAGGCVYALGRREDGRPWRVAVQDPRDPSRALGEVLLADRAVDTSGDYQRWFEAGGRRYHHLLDPATGLPARGLVSVTVVAPRAAAADALATAAFVLGPARGPALLRGQPGVAGLLVDARGRVLRTPGFPGRSRSRSAGVGPE